MKRFQREDSAQAIVLIAVVTSVLLLGVGIAIDAGQLYVARRAAQTAADASAWAGAVEIYEAGLNGFGATAASDAKLAAITDAGRNGYTISGSDVNVPPTSGPLMGDRGFVEVTITEQVQTFFFPGPRPVTVRSVAGATRSGSGEAVHVLRPSSNNTLDLAGAARLDVTAGRIQVNSSGNTSIRIASGGITAQSSRAAGTPGVGAGDAGQVSPAVIPLSPAIADPFLTLPGPASGVSRGAQDINNLGTVGSPVVLDPGYYVGGIRIRGASVVTFNPGIYVLIGGGSDRGLTVSNSAQLNMASASAGVLIFNTHANYLTSPSGSTNCGPIDLNTTGSITLRAQRVGSYAGIVIFQDRNCSTAETMQSRSTGTRNISGTIYVPGSLLDVRGAGSLTWASQLVVYQLLVNATDLNLTFTPGLLAGGRVPAIVE